MAKENKGQSNDEGNEVVTVKGKRDRDNGVLEGYGESKNKRIDLDNISSGWRMARTEDN